MNSSSIINKLKRNSNLKVRESNFELMRIVSMFLIILGHVIGFGYLIDNNSYGAIKEVLNIMMYILIMHVNSFIILSGFFQSNSKFRLSKLFSLILQVIMYSFIIYCISIKIGWITNYNIVSIFCKLLPSSIGSYWFISSYIIVYMFSDYINKFISRLSKVEFKKLLLVLFFILSIIPFFTGKMILDNNGYNFYNFIFLYMIGAYLRRYPLRESYHFKVFSTNGYRFLMIFMFICCFSVNYLLMYYASNMLSYSNLFGEISSRILSNKLTYSNSLIIIQSVCFFEFFRYIKINSKVINYISSCVFGVYLFHENAVMRNNIYSLFNMEKYYNSYKLCLYIIVCTLIIFSVGVLIESVRKLFLKFISNLRIVKKLVDNLKNLCLSFNLKINW